jgi:hypothetical protein
MVTKKKLYWITGSFIGLLAVLVAVEIFTIPKFINSEWIKTKIQAQFKEGIGGETAWQHIGITLFPLPRVTISALTVSMPGHLSGSVEKTYVYPEFFPLFKGIVKIKKLQVFAPDVTLFVAGKKEQDGQASLDALFGQTKPQIKISIDDGSLTIKKKSGNLFYIDKLDAVIAPMQESFQYQVSGRAKAWKRLKIKGEINLKTFQGAGRAVWEELQPQLLLDDLSPNAPFSMADSVVDLDLDFSMAGKNNVDVKINGTMPDITLQHGAKEITFRGKQFSGRIQKQQDLTTIQLQRLVADFPRCTASGKFVIDTKTPQVNLALTAEDLQVASVREIALFFAEGEDLMHDIFNPFRSGDIPKVDFAATGATFGDLAVFSNMNFDFSLHNATVSLIEDEQQQITVLQTDAVIKDGGLALQNVTAQKGRSVLSAQTAHITFDDVPYFKLDDGETTLFAEDFQSFIFKEGLAGDFGKKIDGITGQLKLSELQIAGPLLNPQAWQLTAKGGITHVTVSTPSLQNPVEITHAVLSSKWDKEADKNKILIQEAHGTFDTKSVSMSGVIDHSAAGTDFDLQVKADELDFNLFTTGQYDEEVKQAVEKDTFWDMPVSGKLNLTSEYILYDKYTFTAVQADFLVGPHLIESTNASADLCGISVNGAMRAEPRSISFSLQPAAQEQDIDASLPCLFGDRAKFSGKYSLQGEISSQGAPHEFIDALQGNFKLDVQGGRVYRSPVLLKIFSLLSVTDVFKGKLPQFSNKGFSYKVLKGQADVKGGKIIVNEVVFESDTINLAGYGEIDITNDKLNLVVLVTMLDSVKKLLEIIPFIKNIAGKDLLTYPVKVNGTITDPKVSFLSPTELGKKAIGILGRTLKLPLDIIKPVLPKKKNNK